MLMERMRKRNELKSDLHDVLKHFDARFVDATVDKLEAMEKSDGIRFEDLDDVTVPNKDMHGRWGDGRMEQRAKVVVWAVLERHCPIAHSGARYETLRLGLPY